MKMRKGVREESRESLNPSYFIYFLSVPTMWKPGKGLLSFNKMLHATNYIVTYMYEHSSGLKM